MTKLMITTLILLHLFVSGQWQDAPLAVESETAQVPVKQTLSDQEIAQYKPNELGKVIVVMLHNLVDDVDKEGYYARSSDNLRRDFERLYEEGYVPISMSDFIAGKIDVPLGKTPILLTFDDGDESNFRMLADGTIDPNSAVGIMEAMAEKYADYTPHATFYLNGNNFFGNEQSQEKLSFLMAHGYELGNHSLNHENLSKITRQARIDTIDDMAKQLQEMTGQTSYHFAVPFGVKPDDYQSFVREDSWQTERKMLSSLNVGWNPVLSPHHADFNPYDINRVTIGDDDFELKYWLDYFQAHPEARYISDGDVTTITTYQSQADQLSEQSQSHYDIRLLPDGDAE